MHRAGSLPGLVRYSDAMAAALSLEGNDVQVDLVETTSWAYAQQLFTGSSIGRASPCSTT
jgi:hypothetical protein